MLEHAVAPQYNKRGGEMPADYSELLKDLDEQEKELMAQLNVLRAARPAIFQLKARQELNEALLTPARRFAGLGVSKAILEVLKNAKMPLTTGAILTVLREGGWTTNAQSPLGTVSATLGQLKDVEKVGDGWRLKIATDQDQAWERDAIGSLPLSPQ
jgi:hypothetical protein